MSASIVNTCQDRKTSSSLCNRINFLFRIVKKISIVIYPIRRDGGTHTYKRAVGNLVLVHCNIRPSVLQTSVLFSSIRSQDGHGDESEHVGEDELLIDAQVQPGVGLEQARGGPALLLALRRKEERRDANHGGHASHEVGLLRGAVDAAGGNPAGRTSAVHLRGDHGVGVGMLLLLVGKAAAEGLVRKRVRLGVRVGAAWNCEKSCISYATRLS